MVVAILVLLFCKFFLGSLLKRFELGDAWVESLVRSAPMYAVVIGVVIVQYGDLDVVADVAVVGVLPSAMPEFSLIALDTSTLRSLVPSSLLIAMVIFMESTSIGTAVASKSREKINANQELMGLGAANVGLSAVCPP